MILFYCQKRTPRVRYAVRLLLKDLLGLEIRFTTDKEEYIQATFPKINYSKNPIQSGLYIQPASLLFETDISQQDFKTTYDGEVPLLFLTGKNSILPFDPFAAAFYLVSRYEEYIPFIADEHNRFPAQESRLYKLNSLHQPVVNMYAEMLAEALSDFYPNIEFNKPGYRFLNSVDIDNASAFLGKGVFRILGSYARDLLRLNLPEMWSRTQSVFLGKPDPFDTFDYVLSLQEKHGFESIYFALFSKLGQYDRSLTRYSQRLQRYIKGIGDFCEVGIHPSYRASEDTLLFEEELLALERVLRKDVTKSRQHFLKLSFPKTYRSLLEMEITDDYTMGFATEPGFRAGICTPFHFYDLEQEIETGLVVHPFPFMDGTFIYHKQLTPDEALKHIKYYVETYRKYGGEFIPVWHNRIFSQKESEWRGWNEVFEEMIALAV